MTEDEDRQGGGRRRSPTRRASRTEPTSPAGAERQARKLRTDAYYSYLDGRVKRARQLNKAADVLMRAYPSGRAAGTAP